MGIFNCKKNKSKKKSEIILISYLAESINIIGGTGLYMSFIKRRLYHLPSTIPHAVFLPRTRLPFTWYSLSLPTTAKGIASYGQKHFNTDQCTSKGCNFMRRNKHRICPSALTFCIEDAGHKSERLWATLSHGTGQNHAINVYERTKRTTYSDFIIFALVLHVIIKLFLRVKLNPARLQLLPYLQHNTRPWKQVVMWHIICVHPSL